MSKPSIFFPVVDNGMGLVRTGYASSLVKAFMCGAFNGHAMGVKAYSYPYPDGAMCFAANDFLESEFERFIVIDGDIIFQPAHISYLLSHDLPFVCGMYPKKKPGLEWCIDLPEGASFPDTDPFEDPLMEVEHCARGFVSIHRTVFEQLSKRVPTYICPETGKTRFAFWKNYLGGHSDDYAFCDLWREIGGKVMLDRRCQLMHEVASIFPIAGTFDPYVPVNRTHQRTGPLELTPA